VSHSYQRVIILLYLIQLLKNESRINKTCAYLAFSPRKTAFSLYVYSATEKSKVLVAELGKFKMSKACIYIKKLSDINIPVLHELCKESIHYINENYECACRMKE
jgi:hypothetical protein